MSKNNKNNDMSKSELFKILHKSNFNHLEFKWLSHSNWSLILDGALKEQTMNKEQGFNQTQINQLAELINTLVPPMIDKAIETKVPLIVEKIVDQKLEPINQRLDRIEQRLDKVEQKLDDVEQRLNSVEQEIKDIKACPTIKKELNNK